MSHVVKIDLKVTSLPALKAACAGLGLEFVEGQSNYRWYGRYVGGGYQGRNSVARVIPESEFGKNAEHVIRVPGNVNAYEIGVVRNTDGPGWSLVYDNWQGGKGLEVVAGKDLVKLKVGYGEQVVMAQARKIGAKVSMSVVNGLPRLVLTTR